MNTASTVPSSPSSTVPSSIDELSQIVVEDRADDLGDRQVGAVGARQHQGEGLVVLGIEVAEDLAPAIAADVAPGSSAR